MTSAFVICWCIYLASLLWIMSTLLTTYAQVVIPVQMICKLSIFFENMLLTAHLNRILLPVMCLLYWPFLIVYSQYSFVKPNFLSQIRVFSISNKSDFLKQYALWVDVLCLWAVLYTTGDDLCSHHLQIVFMWILFADDLNQIRLLWYMYIGGK